MQSDQKKLLDAVSGSARALIELVSTWQSSTSNLLDYDSIPFACERESAASLIRLIESACWQTIEVCEDVECKRRDSVDLVSLGRWRTRIAHSLSQLDPSASDDAAWLEALVDAMCNAVDLAAVSIGDQVKGRRSFYVYLHKTMSGRVFYVGKGTGNRAWSRTKRHRLWVAYIEKAACRAVRG